MGGEGGKGEEKEELRTRWGRKGNDQKNDEKEMVIGVKKGVGGGWEEDKKSRRRRL